MLLTGRDEALFLIAILSACVVTSGAIDRSAQYPSSSRFWSYIYDQLQVKSEDLPGYWQSGSQHYSTTTTSTTTTSTTTPRPTPRPTPAPMWESADSLSAKKAAFMALDNEGKMTFIQQVLASQADKHQGSVISPNLTPAQKKEAFMALNPAGKVAYLREIAASG